MIINRLGRTFVHHHNKRNSNKITLRPDSNNNLTRSRAIDTNPGAIDTNPGANNTYSEANNTHDDSDNTVNQSITAEQG